MNDDTEYYKERLKALQVNASTVFVAVTGGKISDPYTDHNEVVQAHDEYLVDRLNEQAEQICSMLAESLHMDLEEIKRLTA